MAVRKAKAPTEEELLWVDVREAKPNHMFTEAQRQSVRFLIYNKYIPCAECGKKRRGHWTMICEFLAKSMGFLVLTDSGLVHPPLTPVCGDHPLVPAWPPTEHRKETDDDDRQNTNSTGK